MSETGDDVVIPALYEHCMRAYRAMLSESKVLLNGEQQMVVYEGFLTQLITQQLNLSVPYYTSIRRALIRMGCIKQLRRGGGTSPSQWEMVAEPTLEAFQNQTEKKEAKVSKADQNTSDILALSQRVNELEDTVLELVQAWAREFGAKEVTK